MSDNDTPPTAPAVENAQMPVPGRTRQRRPAVEAFYEPRTSSVQYVVADPATRACAIIDPVLDFDEKSGSVATRSADGILSYVKAQGLEVAWILDTHPHADHFSAAAYLAEQTGAPTAIGRHIAQVQALWKDIYDLDDGFACDGSQWNRLFDDGDVFRIGQLSGRVMHSPGHTLASVTYVVGDAAFIHDTLFMPDSGSARADFPGGDARQLWQSIQAILALPGNTRLFTGHDYQPGGRLPRWESTVDEQKQSNIHVAEHDLDSYVRLRSERDRTLPMPKLILPSLQVNLRAGRLPEPGCDGRRFLKIPLNCFPGAAWGGGS
jgi:glyoxylase-like metal-dependent hydrolase (beta-lactamase superfamily II)